MKYFNSKCFFFIFYNRNCISFTRHVSRYRFGCIVFCSHFERGAGWDPYQRRQDPAVQGRLGGVPRYLNTAVSLTPGIQEVVVINFVFLFSICEFDVRVFRGCCAMWASVCYSVGPSQSHASFSQRSVASTYMIACYYCNSTILCVCKHTAHDWRQVWPSYWGTGRKGTSITHEHGHGAATASNPLKSALSNRFSNCPFRNHALSHCCSPRPPRFMRRKARPPRAEKC